MNSIAVTDVTARVLAMKRVCMMENRMYCSFYAYLPGGCFPCSRPHVTQSGHSKSDPTLVHLFASEHGANVLVEGGWLECLSQE